MQTRSPQDLDKTDRPLYKILQAFEQCTTATIRRRPGVQA